VREREREITTKDVEKRAKNKKRTRRNSRGLKEISQTVIFTLAPLRSPRRIENKKQKREKGKKETLFERN
jgi:hypothetical protein